MDKRILFLTGCFALSMCMNKVIFAGEAIKEKEYVIYSTPLLERPNPGRRLASKEIVKNIFLRLAQDEYEPAAFSVFTKENLKDVAINWTALKGNGNQVIPREAVDVRILKTWAWESKYGEADILATDLRVPFKDGLENYASLPRFIPEIPPNSSCHFWVKVYASPTQPPGTYQGEITLTPTNNLATTIPLKVEVLPFQLAEPGKDVGFFYTRVIPYEGRPENSGPYLEAKKAILADLTIIRKSGFNLIDLFGYAHLWPGKSAGSLNPDYAREILSLAAQAGFKKVILEGAEHIIVKGIPENEQEAADLASAKVRLSERVKEVVKISKELGIENLYFFGSDEPETPNAVERCRIIFEVVRSAGGKTIVAIINDKNRKPLENLLDVALMSGGAQGSEIFRLVTEGKKTPHEKVYYYCNVGSRVPVITRLYFGWYLYKTGFDGSMPWAYFAVPSVPKPFDHWGRDLNHAFPTKDEPIPTLSGEAAREGVDDLRYIRTLEKFVKASSNQVMAKKAEDNLKGILDQISLVFESGISSANYLIPPEKYQEFRKILQDSILSLIPVPAAR